MARTFLLDYGAGNVRSVVNAVKSLGHELEFIRSVDDFMLADQLIFPGVGAFGACMERLEALGFVEPLKAFIASGRPFLGICLGLQTLFQGSDENPGVEGLGLIPSRVSRFTVDRTHKLAVPEIGWNGVNVRKTTAVFGSECREKYYFVHSFLALPNDENKDWILATTNYGPCEFISIVQHGNVLATQFHPEKSGRAGLALFEKFLNIASLPAAINLAPPPANPAPTKLAPRVIACLDVRANDAGDLVVTKGDQYDVREKAGKNDVRNLGKPVELAARYYIDGADEITFLNITSFRSLPLQDQPMLEVLRQTSERVFVPLTIGGGIKDTENEDGTQTSALEIASEYFRSGADKISIGSDAVLIAEQYIKTGIKTGRSSIETISRVYGAQAVVISVDPKKAYVASPGEVHHHTYKTSTLGPHGEEYCWYQCTIKGGRELRELGAYEMVQACEALGAGEVLLNCMDKDGTNSGFDLEFVNDIKEGVSIPVIASSGAGSAQHFYDVFTQTRADAALAAGIFHRNEVSLPSVKNFLLQNGVPVRPPYLPCPEESS